MLRKLAWEVGFLVEGIGEHAFPIDVVGLGAVGGVGVGEEVRGEVGGGVCRGSKAHAVVVVGRDDGVDGAYIHVVGVEGVACLDEVFDEGFEAEEDVFEAFDVGEAVEETVYLSFGGGEFDLSVFVPERVVLHGCVGFAQGIALDVLEEGAWDFFETDVGESGDSLHLELAEPLGELQFDEHIVGGGDAVTALQLGEVLGDEHVLDEVDVAATGDGEFHTAHLEGGVGIEQDVEVTGKAEVLLVVRQELNIDHFVLFDEEGVLQVVAVEGDGAVGNGRLEGELQQTAFFLVDIDIGEDVFEGGGEDFAGVDEFCHSLVAFAFDDLFFGLGVFAVINFGEGFIDGEGKGELARLWGFLHMVFQKGKAFVFSFVKDFVTHLIEGEGHFLIFSVGEEIF